MRYGDLVSVVIPTYNRSRLIERAVRGVLAQTYDALELIVVDDASSDDTVAILENIYDPRLRILRQPQNAGAGAARHAGVLTALAQVIAFQDSDDAWLPDKLEAQVRHLEQLGPDYVGTFAPEIIYGRDGQGTGKRYGPRRVACVPGPDMQISSGDLSRALMWGNFITLQTLLFRKSAYFAAGGFDLSLPNNEDWDFNLRLSRQGPLGFQEVPQVIVNDSADGISKRADANAYSMLMIFGKLKRAHPDAPQLAPHALSISRQLMADGRPRASRQFLRKAISLKPRDWKLWIRLGLSAFPGLYASLIARQRRKRRVDPAQGA